MEECFSERGALGGTGVSFSGALFDQLLHEIGGLNVGLLVYRDLVFVTVAAACAEEPDCSLSLGLLVTERHSVTVYTIFA